MAAVPRSPTAARPIKINLGATAVRGAARLRTRHRRTRGALQSGRATAGTEKPGPGSAGRHDEDEQARPGYHDTMTPSAFAGLSDADRYVVGRLAAREHVPAEELAELPQAEIDQHIPGARVVYEHREQIAAELLRRRGIDPTSAEYRAAAVEARNVLDQIDQLGSGHTA